jgi:hypothetical protein
MTKKDGGRRLHLYQQPDPLLWITSDGRVEEAHAPTQDELKDLFQGLMEWRKAQPEAMPTQLWDKLDKFIQWHILPSLQWTQEQKDRVRWEYVCKGIDRGYGWDGALEYASNCLRGTQAEGGPDTMRASYQKHNKALPPEQRRPRTYRRNPRLR